jgi:hypothetical protein
VLNRTQREQNVADQHRSSVLTTAVEQVVVVCKPVFATLRSHSPHRLTVTRGEYGTYRTTSASPWKPSNGSDLRRGTAAHHVQSAHLEQTDGTRPVLQPSLFGRFPRQPHRGRMRPARASWQRCRTQDWRLRATLGSGVQVSDVDG